jgi:hypothetical protein
MLSRRALLAVGLPTIAVNAARAQDHPTDGEDYPNHPVTFVVPFAPAGGTDILTRLLAQKLEQRLGKPTLSVEFVMVFGFLLQPCRKAAPPYSPHYIADGTKRRSRRLASPPASIS